MYWEYCRVTSVPLLVPHCLWLEGNYTKIWACSSGCHCHMHFTCLSITWMSPWVLWGPWENESLNKFPLTSGAVCSAHEIPMCSNRLGRSKTQSMVLLAYTVWCCPCTWQQANKPLLLPYTFTIGHCSSPHSKPSFKPGVWVGALKRPRSTRALERSCIFFPW